MVCVVLMCGCQSSSGDRSTCVYNGRRNVRPINLRLSAALDLEDEEWAPESVFLAERTCMGHRNQSGCSCDGWWWRFVNWFVRSHSEQANISVFWYTEGKINNVHLRRDGGSSSITPAIKHSKRDSYLGLGGRVRSSTQFQALFVFVYEQEIVYFNSILIPNDLWDVLRFVLWLICLGCSLVHSATTWAFSL